MVVLFRPAVSLAGGRGNLSATHSSPCFLVSLTGVRCCRAGDERRERIADNVRSTFDNFAFSTLLVKISTNLIALQLLAELMLCATFH